MCMSSPSVPSVPSVTPAPDPVDTTNANSDAAKEAANKTNRAAALAKGQESTILTSTLGATNPAALYKTKLGQ